MSACVSKGTAYLTKSIFQVFQLLVCYISAPLGGHLCFRARSLRAHLPLTYQQQKSCVMCSAVVSCIYLPVLFLPGQGVTCFPGCIRCPRATLRCVQLLLLQDMRSVWSSSRTFSARPCAFTPSPIETSFLSTTEVLREGASFDERAREALSVFAVSFFLLVYDGDSTEFW